MSGNPSPSQNRICPVCRVNPITSSRFRHCSRQCALRGQQTPLPSPNIPPSAGAKGRQDPPPATPTNTYLIAITTSSIPLCPICEEKPPNPGFRHCSKDCALAEKAIKVVTPGNLIKMWLCEVCGSKITASGFRYCSASCSRKALVVEDAFDTLSVSIGLGPLSAERGKCIIESCEKMEWKPGSRYCGDSCRKLGGILLLDPMCLYCREFPKSTKSLFCSGSCGRKAAKAAPCLLQVPDTHNAFTQARNQFIKEWKHSATPPEVCNVFLIVLTQSLHGAFEAKLTEIDSQHNFRSEGQFPANERRRWHGTTRECRVGDPGFTTTAPCRSPTCYLCVVMRHSFDAARCRSGCMFGRGVYTTGTSSKAHIYVKQSTSSPYRAMLLNRVLAGKAKRLTVADHSLTRPPPGHHSVRGIPGDGLNYDEIVVYDNDAIRPLYLVVYKAPV